MTMKRYIFLIFMVLLLALTACETTTQIPPTMAPTQIQTKLLVATPTQIPPTITSTQTQSKLLTAAPTQGTNVGPNVQSELIRGILKRGPETGKYLVYGVVRFAGQVIISYTDTSPDFWVRDENSGNAVDTQVTYDPLYGEYLYSLPVGIFGISANVVLGERYPTPGDYTSFTKVTVEGKQPTLNQDLALTRIIHLISPFDNTEPWDIGFDRQKPWDTPLLENKTVLFSWDAIPEAFAYYLTITEVQYNPQKNLQWKNIQTHYDDRITDTSLEIELPSSPEDNFYSARLYAIDTAGNYVGSLMIKLKNGGWGWDVRFRVP
jgi:hypothetical protein